MRLLLAALLAAVAVVACSSHPPRTGGETGSGTGMGTGTGTGAETGTGSGTGTGTGVGLTHADCDALISHVLEVGLADIRARKPADEVPTDEQVAELRAKLSAEMMDMCLAWDRPSYDCMMAANDPAGLNACASAPADQ